MSASNQARALQQQFVQIIQKYNAAIDSEQLKPLFRPPLGLDIFFDLDKLWHDPHSLDETAKLLEPIVSSLKADSPFDTIASITSSVGSFGCVPLSAILSKSLNVDHLIFHEVELGKFRIYPLTPSYDDLIQNKQILLFKDVAVRGSSIKTVSELIHGHKGSIAAMLILVDFDPPDRESIVPPGMSKGPVVLLRRQDFNMLEGGASDES